MSVRIVVPLLVALLLLATSKLQAAETAKPDVGFIPTPQPVVEAMLQMAQVKRDDVLYDLGCGDGRLVILAAKHHGARGVGIDIDPERIVEATQKAVATKVADRVEFRQANIFESDFHDANVIALYLLDALNVRLRPRIFAQVKPGTRIVSHAFRMGEWEPDVQRTVAFYKGEYSVFFWVVPANLSGRWTLRAQAAGLALPHVLVLEQAFQKLTLRDGTTGQALGDGRVSGNSFTMSLANSSAAKPMTISGTIKGEQLAGLIGEKRMRFVANREPGSETPLDPTAARAVESP